MTIWNKRETKKIPHVEALSSTVCYSGLNPLKICILMLPNCINNLLNRLIFHFAVDVTQPDQV